MFKTIKEAQTWIESVEKFGQKYDLSRMEKACALLNHPQRSFKSIHIAGTNGKGSTLAYLKECLLAANYKVGTFTSPYIVHFNERITLNNVMIDDEDLLYYINYIYDFQKQYLKTYYDQITFFELLTLISFLYFKDHPCDVVLYEVGLGGSLDATNVITPLLSIITSVGYDHMGVLGDSLASIAKNKLGIVKPKIPFITAIEQKSLKPLIKQTALKRGCDWTDITEASITITQEAPLLTFKFEDTLYESRLLGKHQSKNAALAITALKRLKSLGFTVSHEAIKSGIAKAFMPGRFERIERFNTVLDGAHNQEGLKASLDTLKAVFPAEKKIIIFTVMADKDYVPMLAQLKAIDAQVIFTQIPTQRSEKAKHLYHQYDKPNKDYEPNYLKAYEKALRLKDEDTMIYICGSLYFISMMRQAIINKA